MKVQSKALLLLAALLVTAFSSFSNPIGKKAMIAFGQAAFRQKAAAIHPEAVSAELKDVFFLGDAKKPSLAILNFDGGFLVVSGDDAAFPVLAYSFESGLDWDAAAPGARYFIESYQREIQQMRKQNVQPTDEVQREWQALSSKDVQDATVIISPLLTARWNQNKFYNQYSPEDYESGSYYDNRTPNGCVAVAMAMIMYYYRYPECGQGAHTNYTDYDAYYVNFAQQHYCYDVMQDQLEHYNNEVAKLIFHCATSVDMHYASDGSGAYSQEVPNAVTTYFRYSPDCEIQSKHNYNSSVWRQKLKTELNALHPIYYSGYSEDGGHAFVCDGYNSDNHFHFNFGWGGSSNGYYSLSSSNSQAVNGFSSGQAAIFNFYPADPDYPHGCQTMEIIAENGSLEDGSSIFDYQNNQNCTYLLGAPGASSVTITIQSFKTQQDFDSLSFWDKNDSLLLTLSGDMPATTVYDFPTDSLYVTFVTDDSITDAGWRIQYQFNRPLQICNAGLITGLEGTLTDGSGDQDYNPNTSCVWVFRNVSASSITFSFDSLDLSPEDRLVFYDARISPNTLVNVFSGNTIPADFTVNSSKVRVGFFTDNYLNGGGFSFRWTFNIPDNINQAEMGSDSWTVFPNPATNTVNVALPNDWQSGLVSIYDMAGRQVLQQSGSGNNTFSIDASFLSSGIYTIMCQSENKTLKKKLVIVR